MVSRPLVSSEVRLQDAKAHTWACHYGSQWLRGRLHFSPVSQRDFSTAKFGQSKAFAPREKRLVDHARPLRNY